MKEGKEDIQDCIQYPGHVTATAQPHAASGQTLQLATQAACYPGSWGDSITDTMPSVLQVGHHKQKV